MCYVIIVNLNTKFSEIVYGICFVSITNNITLGESVFRLIPNNLKNKLSKLNEI